jgi:hypothetical protein
MDLLVRNVRVGERVVDLGIEGGRFLRIGPELDADAPQVVDAEGRLATPPPWIATAPRRLLGGRAAALQPVRDADRGHPRLGAS